jgi:hypothetical protein
MAALPGNTQIAFKPNKDDSPPRNAGIIANTPLTFGCRKMVRRGCSTSPRANVTKARSITSMHSIIGSSRCTSRSLRITTLMIA